MSKPCSRRVARTASSPPESSWLGSRAGSRRSGDRDGGAVGESQRLAQTVLELAGVAGPVVPLERGERGLGQGQGRSSDLGGGLADEARGQERNVPRPLAQRRQPSRRAPSAGNRDPRGTTPRRCLARDRDCSRQRPARRRWSGGSRRPDRSSCPGAPAGACSGAPARSSPTSSRKIVPRFACSKSPFRSATAPVKLPRTWPNISLSKSSAGIAPMLTATKGASARALSRWAARANSSLPVPGSPARRIGKRGARGLLEVAEEREHRGIAGDDAESFGLAAAGAPARHRRAAPRGRRRRSPSARAAPALRVGRVCALPARARRRAAPATLPRRRSIGPPRLAPLPGLLRAPRPPTPDARGPRGSP